MVDIKLLRKVFDNLDLDKNGVLTFDEVSKGMLNLGFPIDQQDIQIKLFNEMDYDKSGNISFSEFVKYVEMRSEEFYEVFDSIAETRSWNQYEQDDIVFQRGISSQDIRIFLQKFQILASEKQINSFLNLLDEDQMGIISFQEFQAFFALLPKVNPMAVFETFKYTQKFDSINDEMRIPKSLYPDSQNTNYYKILSAAVSGFVSRTATAPIDRLRIMMQFKHPGTKKLSFYEGMKQIYREDGLKGYFKGNGINCMKKVPEIAIKFYVFDSFLQQKQQKQKVTTNMERIVSGGIAGGLGQFFVYPLDIARTRFALAPDNYYKSLYDCIYSIVKNEGITKLYAGLVPTLVGIFPYAGIDIGVYSIIKLQYCHYFQNSQEPSILNLLFSSMVASGFAMFATAPINIVRTRLQSNGLNPVNKRYTGPIDVVKKTFYKEGIRGFYRGTLPALLKVMPATSLSYIVYEELNKKLCPKFG